MVAALLVGCPKGQVGGDTGAAATTGAGPASSTSAATPTTGAPTGGAPETSTSTGVASDGSGQSGESSGAVAGSSGGPGSTSTGAASTGAASTGAASTGGSSTGEAPQLFECFGCTCDAHVSFCRQVFAGFAGPQEEACPVVPEEGLGSGCVLLPPGCDPPSCGCLPLMNNNCFCTEQAPGAFEVTCPLP